jgi:AraC-like DNA-binding protein
MIRSGGNQRGDGGDDVVGDQRRRIRRLAGRIGGGLIDEESHHHGGDGCAILHTGETGMDRIADGLGMSRQTLLRRLKAEGTTVEKILDRLRKRMALGYLEGGKASIDEVAYLVGFSDPAAFSRAFKRWTGMSPKAMRRSQEGQA